MKWPIINGSVVFMVVILLISGLVGWFTFVMGGAHIIEGITNPNPNIPFWEAVLGWTFSIFFFLFGLLCFWVMGGAIKGVYKRYQKRSL